MVGFYPKINVCLQMRARNFEKVEKVCYKYCTIKTVNTYCNNHGYHSVSKLFIYLKYEIHIILFIPI